MNTSIFANQYKKPVPNLTSLNKIKPALIGKQPLAPKTVATKTLQTFTLTAGKTLEETVKAKHLVYSPNEKGDLTGREIEFKATELTPPKGVWIKDEEVAISKGKTTVGGKDMYKLTIQGECEAGQDGNGFCIEIVTGALTPNDVKRCDKALTHFYANLHQHNGSLESFIKKYNDALPKDLEEFQLEVPQEFKGVKLNTQRPPKPNYQTNSMKNFAQLHNCNAMKDVIGEGETYKMLSTASKRAEAILGEGSSDYLKSLLTMVFYDSGNLVQKDCLRDSENVDLLIRTTAEETIFNVLSEPELKQLITALTADKASEKFSNAIQDVSGGRRNAGTVQLCKLNYEHLLNLCQLKLNHPEWSAQCAHYDVSKDNIPSEHISLQRNGKTITTKFDSTLLRNTSIKDTQKMQNLNNEINALKAKVKPLKEEMDNATKAINNFPKQKLTAIAKKIEEKRLSEEFVNKKNEFNKVTNVLRQKEAALDCLTQDIESRMIYFIDEKGGIISNNKYTGKIEITQDINTINNLKNGEIILGKHNNNFCLRFKDENTGNLKTLELKDIPQCVSLLTNGTPKLNEVLDIINNPQNDLTNLGFIKKFPDLEMDTVSSFKAKYYAGRTLIANDKAELFVVVEQRDNKLPGNQKAKEAYLEQTKKTKK